MKLGLIIYARTKHEIANLLDLTGYVKFRKVEPTSFRSRKVSYQCRKDAQGSRDLQTKIFAGARSNGQVASSIDSLSSYQCLNKK